jgi:RimJ/RimL family protein N-acetyltransferase
MTDERRRIGPRFIMGDGITLRRLERGDLEHIRRWLDDPELRTLIGATAPMSEGEAEKWFEHVDSDPSRIWYAIVTDDDTVVGEAGLLRLVPEWRTTDMTIIVGEPSQRGKGYGSETGRLLLDFAFNYLGLHRVAIGVVGFNERALSFWKRLGFREEGLQREGYFHDGAFHDFVMMCVLEDEWRGATGAGDGQ